MARRPSRQVDDMQDDPRFRDTDDTLFDDGSMRLYDDDDDEPLVPKADNKKKRDKKAKPSRPKRVAEPATGAVRVLGGCLQVVTTVIIAVPVFVALGVALALGGRAVGVLPTPPVPTLASRIEVASLPTPAPQLDAPAPADADVVLPTADPGCALAQSWWDSQRENYQYFTERFGNRYTLLSGDEIPPALEEMARRRAAMTVSTTAPCLENARDLIVEGMGTVIAAYTLMQAGDSSGLQTYRDTTETAFTNALMSLWEEWDVATEPSAPSVLNIPRLGGEGCTASAWYDGIREQISGFNAVIDEADPRTVSPGRLRQDVDNMRAIRESIAAAETPPCVAPARDVIVAMMDNYIEGYEAIGNVDPAGTAAAFARASALSYHLHAWLTWLGLEA